MTLAASQSVSESQLSLPNRCKRALVALESLHSGGVRRCIPGICSLAADLLFGLLTLGSAYGAMVTIAQSKSPDPLTPQEASELCELESVIEAGIESFLKTGLAFARIRFYKLHRATHDRFEDYCRDRWALSLSRCNQIINTVKVVTNITGAFPEDAALLAETNEHTLRPLSRLAAPLQTAVWSLIKEIEERPSGTTVQQVVSTIRNAIATGWEQRDTRSATTPTGGGTTPHRIQHRASDELGTLCRWSNRINSWDPTAIAEADDELRLKRHLKAARQLRTFCEAFIKAIEVRLSQ